MKQHIAFSSLDEGTKSILFSLIGVTMQLDSYLDRFNNQIQTVSAYCGVRQSNGIVRQKSRVSNIQVYGNYDIDIESRRRQTVISCLESWISH